MHKPLLPVPETREDRGLLDICRILLRVLRLSFTEKRVSVVKPESVQKTDVKASEYLKSNRA